MINLSINSLQKPLRLLCLGAHSDDIEIGCGATILDLLNKNPNAEVWWIVFSANEKRRHEAIRSAKYFLRNASEKRIIIKDFRESYFPYNGDKIKNYFEELKDNYDPNIIFSHYRNDLHQDHNLICQLTYNTFRDHLILEYEIIKYDGDFGNPNIFVPLNVKTIDSKIGAIIKYFKSQKSRQWFSEDIFYSISKLRGIEINAESGYAESFYCRKMSFAY